MTNRERLERYFPIADFIQAMTGPNCEVVIHDLSDLSHSIIYITSPGVTGRMVGGTITDYLLGLFTERQYEQKDFLVNYTGRGPKNRLLRCSTYFIREEGELIGLMCVNIDISELIHAREVLDAALMIDESQLPEHRAKEDFTLSVGEIIAHAISEATMGADASTLSPEQKCRVVQDLSGRGVFLVKGTIPSVAGLLGVSEQTVYRYIGKMKNE
ncbi:MAG: YheO-like PAS domain protein [Clostridiales bacterium]|uniref:Transcriptional regulator YheO n=1 Tax=Harryflintia acetispora TaxID=1849041 RepID=A0A9X8UM24_9FIRM|nr:MULTISPECIES: PAS domain-containing protein [Oscillospiraceae]PWM36114.1 MAG: YheO-like PAS domain protein [Clostridiales bacterium]RGB68921.1 YheO-like PAS domain protein [Harryflintia acetispora]TCL45242.1 putative transcriptional regulator YheO [Harryflintia acetispora]